MCECGAEVFIVKTQECKRCYQARWRAENLEKRRAQDRAAQARRYVPVLTYTAAVPPTTACSYEVAHQRVRNYRGKASQRVCVCGAQAEQWSYRNSSSYEQQGTREGKPGVFRWSTNITDYDALCRPCHEERDLGKVHKGFFLTASSVPPSAPHFLSLTGRQEAL